MKKVMSIVLAVVMLASVFTVAVNALSVSSPYVPSAAEAVAAYEAEKGTTVSTFRYYFQMPNGSRGGTADEDVYVHDDETDTDYIAIHAGEKAPSWYSDYNVVDGKNYAAIYWWGGPANAKEYGVDWCGFRMEIDDYDQGIYYADVPEAVVTLNWNNGVDGGLDTSLPIYYEAAQTVDTNVELADPGEMDTIPEGCDSFDGYIFVIDPNQISINSFSNKQTCGGNWYVYYGNGCYGSYAEDSDNFVSVEANCVNPDHFNASGVHVGYQGGDTPTEPEPTVHTHTAGTAVRENVKAATCTAEGSYDEVVYCTVCGEELSRTAKTIAKIAHTAGTAERENVKAATCTAAGSYDEVVYCTVCKTELSRTTKTIAKLAHSLTYVPQVDATYDAEGVKAHYVCSTCGQMFSDAAGTTVVTAADLVIEKLIPGDNWGIRGDADNSGEVDIVDVTYSQRVILHIMQGDQGVVIRGDVDGDGTLDAVDCNIIQRWLLGLEQTRHIGEIIEK